MSAALTIGVDIAGAAAAAADLDAVSAAARGVGDAVAAAGAQVDDGANKIDRAAESADGLASTSSTLTGAFGALGSGLSLVGLDQYAAGLESAAMATDFFSGVGDLAALAMNSQAVKTAVATAASVAHSVATGAATAATAVMTAGQWALNAALTANPIGLVVIGVAALIAGLVLAYRHSSSFREAIAQAMDVAKAGIDLVVDGVSGFVGWLKDLPGNARDAWDKVSGSVRDAVDDAQRFFGNLIEDVKTKPGDLVAGVKADFASMFAPIADAIGWVNDLIARIGDIKFPSPPGNPFNKAATYTLDPGSTAVAADTGEVTRLLAAILAVLTSMSQPSTVADPYGAAQSLRALLARADRISF